MPDFALVALPGAYRSSIGALADSFALVRDRSEHLFDGVEPLNLVTSLQYLSIDGAASTCFDGTPLVVDGRIDRTIVHPFIWLPAFRTGGEPGMRERLTSWRPLFDWLRIQEEGGAIIGASGGSVMLLLAAGIGTDLAVPASPALAPVMRALFPRQAIDEDGAVADHGRLLLSRGIGSDLGLVTHAFERVMSPEISRWLSSVMGLEAGAAHHVTDALVARARFWLEQNFSRTVDLAALAAELSTSSATLNRRFHKALGCSPRDYVGQLRLRAAKRMLERSSRPIDQIALLVGYSDSRLFRAMFRKHCGMTATQWRLAARNETTAQAGT